MSESPLRLVINGAALRADEFPRGTVLAWRAAAAVVGIYTPCTPHVHPPYTPYAPSIHPLYTPYTPPIQRLYSPYTLPIALAVSYDAFQIKERASMT